MRVNYIRKLKKHNLNQVIRLKFLMIMSIMSIALKEIGRVKMSNLCTEILQVQQTSVITDQDEPNEYGLDVSCNLGSIDIHEGNKSQEF